MLMDVVFVIAGSDNKIWNVVKKLSKFLFLVPAFVFYGVILASQSLHRHNIRQLLVSMQILLNNFRHLSMIQGNVNWHSLFNGFGLK